MNHIFRVTDFFQDWSEEDFNTSIVRRTYPDGKVKYYRLRNEIIRLAINLELMKFSFM